jgi:uroporphyrinogen III methyltransferase/synthase
MCRQLAELGADCLLQPAIAIEPPDDWSPVDRALEQLPEFDWIVFSSANGVRGLLDRLCELHGDLRLLGGVRLAAIGPRTADELGKYHLRADVQPDAFRAEALADALSSDAVGNRFLLCRASRGREVLAEQLQAAGAEIHQIVVYESRDVTSPDDQTADALADGKIDWITVTSSAIARSIVAMFGNGLHKSRLASISPVTSATLSELGFPPHAEATEYTTAGVIDAMKRGK